MEFTCPHCKKATQVVATTPKTETMLTELDLADQDCGSDYSHLWKVLKLAYYQAATDKGRERHANEKPFHEQPIITISDMVGHGFTFGQAIKKIQEASSMYRDGKIPAVQAELLGAIVYLAAAYLFISGRTE